MSQVAASYDSVLFEQLLTDLSASLVSVSAADIDSCIVAALERLGNFLDIDRVILSELKSSKLTGWHVQAVRLQCKRKSRDNSRPR